MLFKRKTKKKKNDKDKFCFPTFPFLIFTVTRCCYKTVNAILDFRLDLKLLWGLNLTKTLHFEKKRWAFLMKCTKWFVLLQLLLCLRSEIVTVHCSFWTSNASWLWIILIEVANVSYETPLLRILKYLYQLPIKIYDPQYQYTKLHKSFEPFLPSKCSLFSVSASKTSQFLLKYWQSRILKHFYCGILLVLLKLWPCFWI